MAYPWRLNTRIQAWTLGPRTQRHRRVVREVNSTARENVSKADLQHRRWVIIQFWWYDVKADKTFLQKLNKSQTETLCVYQRWRSGSAISQSVKLYIYCRILFCRTTFRHLCFPCQSCKLWKSLPSQIQSTLEIKMFITRTKTWLNIVHTVWESEWMFNII